MILSFAQAVIIVGAVNYCAREPSRPICMDARPAVIAPADAESVLRKLAKRAYLPPARYRDDEVDFWRIRGPRQAGDCDDRILWAHRQLTRTRPDIAASWRFVALRPASPRTLAGRPVFHLVGVIKTLTGTFVLDVEHFELRRWSDVTHAAYTPERGVGGRWIPFVEEAR